MICAVEMFDLLRCDFDVIFISNIVTGFDNTHANVDVINLLYFELKTMFLVLNFCVV